MKNVVWLGLGVGLVLSLSGCGGDSPVVGQVGGHEFTDADIDREFAQMPMQFQQMKDNPAMRANILNNLMTRYALAVKAENEGVLDDPEVKARVDRARETMLIQAMQQKMKLDQKPTDEEVAAFYEQNKAKYDESERVQVRHILLASEAEAQDVLARVRRGDSFADQARKYSKDKSSSANGGQLAPFGKGTMVPEFEAAAFGLKNKGDLAGPIKTSYGFHVLKLEGRFAGKSHALAEVKERVASDLMQKRYMDWVEGVRSDSDLEILDERYVVQSQQSPQQ